MKKVKFTDSSINKSIAELTGKRDHRTLALWAAECAEHVLPYYEEKYPEDDRPRKAIEAGRAWVRGEIRVSEARTAAIASHAAARDTNDNASCAAARAAGHAAATAHVAGHAVAAATYAAKAAAFSSDQSDAAAGTEKERNRQYQHLLDLGQRICHNLSRSNRGGASAI